MASEIVPDLPDFSSEEKQIKPTVFEELECIPIDKSAVTLQQSEHKAGPETSYALRVRRFLAHWAHRLGLLGPFGIFLGISAYILFGALIFWRTTDANVSYGNSIYWAIVTSTTVGYGNIFPAGASAKIFVMFYICISITLVLAAISSLHEYVVERAQQIRKKKTLQELPDMWTVLRATAISLAVSVILVMVGAVFFAFNEGFSWLDSFYFVITTLSTVGYGDIIPQKKSSIGFLALFILIGVPVFAARLNSVLEAVSEYLAVRRDQRMLAKGVTPEMIEAADEDGNGSVDRTEFTLFYLQLMGKLNQDDIDRVHLLFDALDISGDGQLTAEDVRSMAAHPLQTV